MLKLYVLYFCRTYTEPNPPQRVVLDAVSSLITAFLNSLKLGTVRGCSFRGPVRRDEFICFVIVVVVCLVSVVNCTIGLILTIIFL